MSGVQISAGPFSDTVITTKVIPKVQFRVAGLDEFFPYIHQIVTNTTPYGFGRNLYREYPDLKGRLDAHESIDDKVGAAHDFFYRKFVEEKPRMDLAVGRFQVIWDAINDSIMRALADVLQIDWADKDRLITASLTLNVMCPRFLDRREFHVFYRGTAERTIDTCVHELLHFIYFEKWKEVFPSWNESEFQSPHLIWKLSEMMPGIVLNDPRIQSILHQKFTMYKIFEDTLIEGHPLRAHLQSLYDNRTDFTDFLRRAFEFVKAHENEIP